MPTRSPSVDQGTKPRVSRRTVALARVVALWKAQRRSEALAEVEAALAEWPGHRKLTLQRCSFLRGLGRAAEAVAILQPFYRASPDDLTVALELARAYRAAGDHAAGLAMFDAVLAADPEHHGAWVAKVEILADTKRPDGALAATEAALSRLPGDRWLKLRQASLLRGLGRGAEAVAVLGPLYRELPGDPAVAMELGHAQGAAGDHAAMMATFDAVLAANPAHREAWTAKVDDALVRSDRLALAGLARGFFDRLTQTADPGTAILLAQIMPHLDLTHWSAETGEWIAAICPHASRIRPADLWPLHGIAELQGLTGICRQLLAALLNKPSLPLPVATALLRWSHDASEDHYRRMAPELRKRVPAASLRLFDLEHAAMMQGPASAVSGRLREGGRRLDEVVLLVDLMRKAGQQALALRYLSLARRFHPEDSALRRRRLAVLDSVGHAERALREAEAMLAGCGAPSIKDQQAAITTLMSLGHAERALQVLLALENPYNRRSFRRTRLEVMLRLGRFGEARALVAELATLGNARRSMHFGLTIEGLQLIEMGIAEASERVAGPSSHEGRLVGPSMRALDARLAKLPPPRRDGPGRIPRRIMQYWNTGKPPAGLDAIMRSWRIAEGFDYELFDKSAALRFLADEFGAEWAAALRLANHAAEESDFFRLCFLAAKGGIYADCDDRLTGSPDGLVAGQSGLVVYRERKGTIANNLILAEPAHPVLVYAAVSAKQALLRKDNDTTWTKTGPGLLTRAIATALEDAAAEGADPRVTVCTVHEAAPHVQFHISLPYKKTSRYWNASKSGGHLAKTPTALPAGF